MEYKMQNLMKMDSFGMIIMSPADVIRQCLGQEMSNVARSRSFSWYLDNMELNDDLKEYVAKLILKECDPEMVYWNEEDPMDICGWEYFECEISFPERLKIFANVLATEENIPMDRYTWREGPKHLWKV